MWLSTYETNIQSCFLLKSFGHSYDSALPIYLWLYEQVAYKMSQITLILTQHISECISRYGSC